MQDILKLLAEIDRLKAENKLLQERNAMLERACQHWQFLASEQAIVIREKAKKPTVHPLFSDAFKPR